MEVIGNKANGKASSRFMDSLRAIATLGALGAGILLSYGGASAQSQELPDGPGKAFAAQNCTACHGSELLTAKRRSSDEWAEVVGRMISNGDTLTEDQYNEVVAYLGTYLGTAPIAAAEPASAHGTGQTAPVARSAQSKAEPR